MPRRRLKSSKRIQRNGETDFVFNPTTHFSCASPKRTEAIELFAPPIKPRSRAAQQ
jgi:hypothetical protein